MKHLIDFTAGSQGVYILTIANIGVTPTEGAITVTDMLPSGLTYISADGFGWTCSAADEIVTCTNPGPVSSKASSTITLMVSVEPQAWPGVTNLATVTNVSDRSLGNNTVGDPTIVRQGGPQR